MNDWIPLFGPTLTLIGVLGVAVWNGRGESRDIRQLKAMNEVIAGLPTNAEATQAFVDARDGMLVRVAAGIASLPRRRLITWTVVGIVTAALLLVVAGWAVAPYLSQGADLWISIVSAILAVSGGVLVIVSSRVAQKRARDSAQEDIAAMLWTFSEARANPAQAESRGSVRRSHDGPSWGGSV